MKYFLFMTYHKIINRIKTFWPRFKLYWLSLYYAILKLNVSLWKRPVDRQSLRSKGKSELARRVIDLVAEKQGLNPQFASFEEIKRMPKRLLIKHILSISQELGK